MLGLGDRVRNCMLCRREAAPLAAHARRGADAVRVRDGRAIGAWGEQKVGDLSAHPRRRPPELHTSSRVSK